MQDFRFPDSEYNCVFTAVRSLKGNKIIEILTYQPCEWILRKLVVMRNQVSVCPEGARSEDHATCSRAECPPANSLFHLVI